MRKVLFLFLLLSSFVSCYSQVSKILLPVKVGKLWGYIDQNGNMAVTPKYDYAEEFSYGFAEVEKNDKKGIINAHGKEILSPAYDDVKINPVNKSGNGIPLDYIITYKKNDKWGCCDSTGKIILDNVWGLISIGKMILLKKEISDEYYYPVFFTISGIIVSDIPVKYIDKHSNYYIYNGLNNKMGVTDKYGNMLIPAVYDDIEYTGKNLFHFTQNFKTGIIDDKNDTLLSPEYDYISGFKDHLALVKRDDKYGLINDQFKTILEPIYSKVTVSGKKIKGRIKRSLTMVDVDSLGNVIETNQYDNVSTISISGSARRYTDFTTTTSAIDTTYVSKEWFYNDSIKKWGLHNAAGDTVIPTIFNKVYSDKYSKYSLVEVFRKDTLKVSNIRIPMTSYFGIVDHENGKMVVPVRYLNISLEDFKDTSTDIVRCISFLGQWGYLNKKLKFRFYKLPYIEKSGPGLYRVMYTGKLSLHYDFYNNDMNSFYLSNITSSFTRRSDYSYYNSLYMIGGTGEWGYLNNDSLYKAGFQYAGNFTNKRALVKKYDKWGVISDSLYMIVPIVYDSIEFLTNSDKNLFKLHINNTKVGLMSEDGKVLTDMIYDNIGAYSGGFGIAQKKYLMGFLNKNAKEICDFQFKKASDFSDEMAAVKVGNSWGYIDTTGTIVIEPDFSKADDFSEDMAFVTRNNLTGFINKAGETVFNIKCSKALKYINGVDWIRVSGQYGLIDKTGKFIVKPKFNSVLPYSDKGELTIVSAHNKYGIINNKGDIIAPIKYDEISQLSSSGYAIFSKNSKYGYMDETGKVVIDADFIHAYDFNNGYAIVQKNKLLTIIDNTGQPTHNLVKYESPEAQLIKSRDTLKISSINYFSTNDIYKSSKNKSCLVEDVWNDEKFYVVASTVKNHKYLLAKENETDTVTKDITVMRNNARKYVLDNPTVTNYDYTFALGEGLAKYSQNVIYGIADINGRLIFKPKFENIYYYGNDIYKVLYHDLICYMKKDGSWIWKPAE